MSEPQLSPDPFHGVPRLADQMLYAEYQQLANELGSQGISPNTYHENPLLKGPRQGLGALFTWRRKHNGWSLFASAVGCLVTALAFNKVLGPVLPLFLRGPISLPVACVTAGLFVWGAVKLFAVLYKSWSLNRKLRGMFQALECLSGERERIRREALMPMRAELGRFGSATLLILCVLCVLVAAVDFGALFNLLSDYLSPDAPAAALFAVLGTSLFTVAIILGKGVYEGHFYYVPTALHTYGQMYREMAREQFLINQGLLPARVDEERRQTSQEIANLHAELEMTKQANASLHQQLLQKDEQFEHERSEVAANHRQQLEAIRAVARQVVLGHGQFTPLVDQLRLAADPPAPPALPQPVATSQDAR